MTRAPTRSRYRTLASPRITDSSKTRTGLVLGTPSFMAPEQLAGQRVDGRCDLYALGVTLFQLLSGQLPLRGNSMSELMHHIAHTPAPDLRTLRPELPADLAQVVEQALRKSPRERFQTGRQFASALRGVHATLGGGQAPPRTCRQGRRSSMMRSAIPLGTICRISKKP
jgi:serine/threonine protein kinase